jgi:predicted ATPase
VEQIAQMSALLVATFRPEFQPPWIGQPHVTSLSLRRLGREESEELVTGIVGNSAALPSELRNEIIERTDGVPLFLEELTKAILESVNPGAQISATPATSLALPATLHNSLMARLDRLGSAAKEIAQMGAAIGREFSYELLAVLSQRTEVELREAVARFVGAGLVFQRGVPPEAAFLFKHALVQDAAYSMLLRGPRQRLHARIGDVLAKHFSQVADIQPELLAHHFTQAGKHRPAVEYWQRAADRALQRSAYLEAMGHLRKGLDCIKALENGRHRSQLELNLQLGLATALHAERGQAAPEVAQAYQRARQLCEEIEDVPQLFRTLMGLYRFFGGRYQVDIANEMVERLFRLAQQTQDPDMLVEAHLAHGTMRLLCGDLATAQEHLEEAIARYSPEQHRIHAIRFSLDPGVTSLSRASWTLWLRGYPEQALQMSHRTLALAHDLRHVHSLVMALCFAAMLHQFRREPQGVHQLAQAAARLSSEHGLSQWTATAGFLLGWSIAQQGRYDEGVGQMRQSFAAYQNIGAALDLPWYLGLLAESSTINNKTAEGLAIVDGEYLCRPKRVRN